jgi:hypothetical protein
MSLKDLALLNKFSLHSNSSTALADNGTQYGVSTECGENSTLRKLVEYF